MGGENHTYSWSRFCTANCQPMVRNYQLSHLRSGRELNSDLRDGKRECYHSASMAMVFLNHNISWYESVGTWSGMKICHHSLSDQQFSPYPKDIETPGFRYFVFYKNNILF